MKIETARIAFLKQTNAFLSGTLYLMRVEALARTATGEVKEYRDKLTKNIAPIFGSPFEYFSAQLFIAYISAFELHIQDVLGVVLKAHPKKIGKTTLKLSEIVEIGDIDTVVERSIGGYLNEMMYKKPGEYLEDLCEKLSISSVALKANWLIFCEAKARRDLGIHAGWKCNERYLNKLTELGITSQLKVGQYVNPVDHTYLMALCDALDSLSEEICNLTKAVHCGL